MNTKVEGKGNRRGFLDVTEKMLRPFRIKVLEWRIRQVGLSAYDLATSSLNFSPDSQEVKRLLGLAGARYDRRDRLTRKLSNLKAKTS
ncbi:MAG: hypothetical protein V4449_02270 [Patescibacteria group bacterium]